MSVKLMRISAYVIFWSWNLIFTLLIVFLLFPEMIIPIVSGMAAGSVFWDQGLFAILTFLVPLLGIILGLTKNFRQSPRRLLKLFYGLELPLFFLIIARLTLIRELHPGTLHLLILSVIAILAYGVYLFTHLEQKRSLMSSMLRQIIISCSLMVTLYIALLLLFFVFPLGKEFFAELFTTRWIYLTIEEPIIILLTVFLLYSFTLWLGFPLVLITLYSKAFYRHSKQMTKYYGKLAVILLSCVTIAINVLIFYQSNQQDQIEAFALLDRPITSDEQKKQLLEKQTSIRQGLLNAYLASHRYLSTTQSSQVIQTMYARSFGFEREGSARLLQNSFNFLASPFLYQGDSWNSDSLKAEQLYQQFFDTPIDKAESQSINQALKSNWLRDGMQAGLINKDQQKVLITSQAISISEKAHSANITLFETYQNQTFEQQEIYYYFTLPEEAVITGLWLSDDADNLKKYAYTIAPRGAAQKLYRQERERRVDPALLEQVGPEQYRLRVFPVPAKTKSRKEFKVKSEQLHLQMEYQIPLMAGKQWILPKLLEKRNVYWKKSTPLLVNDSAFIRPDGGEQGAWLPSLLPRESAQTLGKISAQLPVNEHQWLQVDIQPRDDLATMESLLKEKLSLAVLIDTSFSMNKLQSSLDEALKSLDSLDKQSSLQIDFFSINDTLTPLEDIDAWLKAKPVFFGYNTTLKQLNQWQQGVSDTSTYDAVLMLTDTGNYESKEQQSISINKQVPLWILHLGDEPAYAYADQLLDYIYQSGGGVGQELDNILFKLLYKKQRSAQQLARISDNYLWLFHRTEAQEILPANSNELAAVIAHQWISADYNRFNADQTAVLDDLHRLAKKHSLVSPFSSMIVLVNQRQKEQLEKLSKEKDRFNRELETGKKSIAKGNDLFSSVSSVPEPEEWALIIVAFIVLMMARIKQKNAFQVSISGRSIRYWI